jgi:glucosamine--fructose-6-phosphate aminotransferase (isomerizing)
MGTALETALKLEETCLRPVRGYSYADLRHGPISVVTTGMTAVLVAAQDGPLREPMVELARDLADRGATTVGIGGDRGFIDACAHHVPGPDLPEALARSARSCRRSWSSSRWHSLSGSTPTTREVWPR